MKLARVQCLLVSVLLAMVIEPFASFSVAAQASRGAKVALVIGNARYEQLAELRNPKRDAAAISDRLRARGFDVSELFDADAFAMQRAVDNFVRQADGADIALFYFSGHGVQLFDQNFLIARDASVGIRELADLGIDLAGLIARLRTAGPVRSALLIDACRDNPFQFDQTASLLATFLAKRGTGPAATTPTSVPTRGLAPVATAPKADASRRGQIRRGVGETLLYFAAQPGAVSFDGEGQNSYFVEGINDALAKGDQPFGEVLRQASAYVRTVTSGKQVPQIVSDWTTDVSLQTRDLVHVEYNISGWNDRKLTADERSRLIKDASSFTKLYGDFLTSASFSAGSKDDAIGKLGFVHGLSLAYDFDRDGSEDKFHVGFQQTSLYMLYESAGVSVPVSNCLDGSPGQMQIALKDLDGDRVPEIIIAFTTEDDGIFGEFCILKLRGIERLDELRRAKAGLSSGTATPFRTLLRSWAGSGVEFAPDNTIKICSGTGCHTWKTYSFDGEMFRWTASDAGPMTGIDAVPFRDVVERARHYHAAYLAASQPLHPGAWSLVSEKEGNWWKAVTTLPDGATFGYACQNNSGTISHTFQVELPTVSKSRSSGEIWRDPDLTSSDALEAAPVVIDGHRCSLAADQYYVAPDDKDRKFILALDSMQAKACVESLSRARAVAVPLLHGTRSGPRGLLQVGLAGGAQTIVTAASRCAQGIAADAHPASARSPAQGRNRK